jgi:hypothetical protein
LQDVSGHLIATTHRHTYDVFATARAEGCEIVLGHHARIAYKHTPAQFPPAQIVFDLGDGRDIDRIAWKHPVAYGQAITCHRQPDHNLRGIGATIFRHAAFARRFVDSRTRRHAPFDQILVTISLIDIVDFKM